MSLSDKFLVAFLVVWNVLIGLFWLIGLPGWALCWLAIEVVVGITEAVSKWRTGHTITQNFRRWASDHWWQAIGLIGLLLLSWVLLLLHLGIK